MSSRSSSLWSRGPRALLLLLALSGTIHAAVYDFTLPNAGNRAVRLNIPESVSVVRGIVIWGNGANYDSRGMATDPEIVAFAESIGFAALATSMWSWFDPSFNPSELSGFEYALQQLAATSGHPELVRAPWLPVGQSNGGSISWGLNAARPEKVIAVAINKAGASTPRPGVPALRTPTILVSGEHDLARRSDAVRDLFEGNRARGLFGAWAVEEASNHTTGDSFELILPFVAEVYRLRYPAGASPRSAPVTLLNLSEASGWLTRTQSGTSGFAEIAPYAGYTGDRATAGWLPNRRLAYIFRAFASYDLGRFEATLSSGTGPIDWGSPVTFTLGAPARSWQSIEFYEGDTLLKQITPADGERLELTTRVVTAGYNVFHAIITRTDGTQRTTMPRRVFVRAPAIGAVAGATTVATGGTTVLTAAAPSGVSAHRWQMDAGAGWQVLEDGAILAAGNARCSGTNTASLTISEATGALNAARFRCTFSVGASTQQSSAVSLVIAARPAVTIVAGAPGTAVSAGTAVTMAVESAGSSNTSYRWYRDGAAVPSGAGPSVNLIAGAGNAGAYEIVVTDAAGLSTSVQLGNLLVSSDARIANLSARARVGSGDDILIGGFVTAGAPATVGKRMLVRAIGPEMSRTQGVAGALAAAQLRLFDRNGVGFAAATGWAPELASTFARLGAFPLPLGSADAALLEEIQPGVFTAHVTASNGSPGVGLVEVYDADEAEPAIRLANISARARIGTGENILIGGFVVTGTTSATVLIRAVGPGMRHLLPGAIAKTALTIFDGQGNVIAANTGWKQPFARGSSPVAAGIEPATVQVMSRVGASLLPVPQHLGYDSSWDSALLLTLPPGVYTAHMGGAEEAAGIGLIEIYEVR